MRKKKANRSRRGALTVFFTLLSAVFLGLFSVLIESVRYRGAHAQAYLATDLGTTSVFAEYDSSLLERFDLFAVDASYGTGDFDITRVQDHLKEFVQANASPSLTEGLTGMIMIDPWQISMTDAQVGDYALLSDDGGEYFYQQAVTYMHDTLISTAADKIITSFQDAKDMETKEKDYKDKDLSLDKEVQDLKTQERTRESELIEEGGAVPVKPETNPLDTIRELMKKDPLTLLCPDGISNAKIKKKDLCSARKKNKGTLTLNKEYGGVLDDLYYREYLMDHFRAYTDEDKTSGALSYELEYLLNGKKSDRRNLKLTIVRLLAIRESVNYLYCVSNARMNSEASALATALTGWTGLAPVVIACKHALLLGWAFGESLLDVRTLMSGGRVPLVNTPETWILSIDNLEKVADLLKGDNLDREKGLNYRRYLRLMIYLQGIKKQKKRGLDLVELRMRSGEGTSNFRADNCVIALKDKVTYNIPPLWSRVTYAFLSAKAENSSITVEGGFAYDDGS